MKHNNKIALSVGWKICCCYLVATLLRVGCSLHGQCKFAVVAMAKIERNLNIKRV
jgi:hypothetical protein